MIILKEYNTFLKKNSLPVKKVTFSNYKLDNFLMFNTCTVYFRRENIFLLSNKEAYEKQK